VKGIGLDYKKCQATIRYRTIARSIHSRSRSIVYKTQLRDLSIQDRGLLFIKHHTPPLFPVTSNCFSFEHRSILKSIPAVRIQVGLLGEECNILNPYEMGKYPLACCVSGSRLENRTTACVVLLK